MTIRSGLLVSLPVLLFSLSAAQQAAAQNLDADMAKKVMLDKTWARKNVGGQKSFWSWSSDGTVCIRLFERSGKCDDTARWWMDGENVCYEAQWWGGNLGLKSSCFRIVDAGNGRYDGISKDLKNFEFTMVK